MPVGDEQPHHRAWLGRALDGALVVVLLPLVLPIAALVAVAVWLDSPGPIIYRSRRIGLAGCPFDLFKFRTMVRDARGPLVSAAGDCRFTPLGAYLARSRLDELPQLLNILRGEMRFVGPRPELEEFVAANRADYELILSVPPGLTGPAQLAYVSEGKALASVREQEREALYLESVLPEKVLIDKEYAQGRTGLADLAILVRTLLLPLTFASAAILRAFVGARPGQLRNAHVASTIFLVVVFVSLFASEGVA